MLSFFNNLFLVIKQCLKTQVLLIVRFNILKKKVYYSYNGETKYTPVFIAVCQSFCPLYVSQTCFRYGLAN